MVDNVAEVLLPIRDLLENFLKQGEHEYLSVPRGGKIDRCRAVRCIARLRVVETPLGLHLHSKVLSLSAIALGLGGVGPCRRPDGSSMRHACSGLGQPSGRLGHRTRCFQGVLLGAL